MGSSEPTSPFVPTAHDTGAVLCPCRLKQTECCTRGLEQYSSSNERLRASQLVSRKFPPTGDAFSSQTTRSDFSREVSHAPSPAVLRDPPGGGGGRVVHQSSRSAAVRKKFSIPMRALEAVCFPKARHVFGAFLVATKLFRRHLRRRPPHPEPALTHHRVVDATEKDASSPGLVARLRCAHASLLSWIPPRRVVLP